ncbi:MAG: hypothetical protein Q9220_007216 [cf. Caloplaca sp. 1 TL-2023]
MSVMIGLRSREINLMLFICCLVVTYGILTILIPACMVAVFWKQRPYIEWSPREFHQWKDLWDFYLLNLVFWIGLLLYLGLNYVEVSFPQVQHTVPSHSPRDPVRAPTAQSPKVTYADAESVTSTIRADDASFVTAAERIPHISSHRARSLTSSQRMRQKQSQIKALRLHTQLPRIEPITPMVQSQSYLPSNKHNLQVDDKASKDKQASTENQPDLGLNISRQDDEGNHGPADDQIDPVSDRLWYRDKKKATPTENRPDVASPFRQADEGSRTPTDDRPESTLDFSRQDEAGARTPTKHRSEPPLEILRNAKKGDHTPTKDQSHPALHLLRQDDASNRSRTENQLEPALHFSRKDDEGARTPTRDRSEPPLEFLRHDEEGNRASTEDRPHPTLDSLRQDGEGDRSPTEDRPKPVLDFSRHHEKCRYSPTKDPSAPAVRFTRLDKEANYALTENRLRVMNESPNFGSQCSSRKGRPKNNISSPSHGTKVKASVTPSVEGEGDYSILPLDVQRNILRECKENLLAQAMTWKVMGETGLKKCIRFDDAEDTHALHRPPPEEVNIRWKRVEQYLKKKSLRSFAPMRVYPGHDLAPFNLVRLYTNLNVHRRRGRQLPPGYVCRFSDEEALDESMSMASTHAESYESNLN